MKPVKKKIERTLYTDLLLMKEVTGTPLSPEHLYAHIMSLNDVKLKDELTRIFRDWADKNQPPKTLLEESEEV